MADKQPYMKFFPADYLSEETLRGRTLAARGLWMDMICIMHKSSRRGFLLNKAGAPIDSSQLAIMVGAGAKEVTRLLQELERAETFSRDKDGVIYCRRMVEKANLSLIRSECGAMGGRPPKSKEANQKQNESKVKAPSDYDYASASGFSLSQKQEAPSPRDSAPIPRPGSLPLETHEQEAARLRDELDFATGGNVPARPRPERHRIEAMQDRDADADALEATLLALFGNKETHRVSMRRTEQVEKMVADYGAKAVQDFCGPLLRGDVDAGRKPMEWGEVREAFWDWRKSLSNPKTKSKPTGRSKAVERFMAGGDA